MKCFSLVHGSLDLAYDALELCFCILFSKDGVLDVGFDACVAASYFGGRVGEIGHVIVELSLVAAWRRQWSEVCSIGNDLEVVGELLAALVVLTDATILDGK